METLFSALGSWPQLRSAGPGPHAGRLPLRGGRQPEARLRRTRLHPRLIAAAVSAISLRFFRPAGLRVLLPLGRSPGARGTKPGRDGHPREPAGRSAGRTTASRRDGARGRRARTALGRGRARGVRPATAAAARALRPYEHQTASVPLLAAQPALARAL